ncbi:MAG: polysaccharide deacetylase family protein [Betaproteobacteria bacterium]|nr:polysaccharide deacetylase family protein [Betaproteobacteria bacterium]
MFKSHWQPSLLIRATLVLHGAALLALITAPLHWRWVLAALIANHVVLALTGLWPRSHWLGPNWTHLPVAATARSEIALTIDDGPDPLVTPQVLDVLERHGVQATFFCIGESAQHYPDLCRDIVRRGHAIENHSQHHRYDFSLLGMAGLTREIQAAQAALTEITGQRPQFFRAPAGLRNPFLDPVLARMELKLASWSVRAFDTREGDPEKVKRKLLKGLRAGAIVLLHDAHAARTPAGYPVILEALPTLLDAAAAAGLHWVTLPQALS